MTGRRATAAAVVVVVLLGAQPASAATWRPAVQPARDYAEQRAGTISFAVIGTDGALRGPRRARPVVAMSVVKVMFMVAYLRQPSVRDRPLDAADRDLLRPMIRRSDNATATRIADMVGPRAMNRLARRAGMQDFAYTRPWGHTRTSARDQARFMLELDRHLPARHRRYALRLLASIVEQQRWGIGEVQTPGWTAHFKGGWGAGTGAAEHQVVLLRHEDGTQVALAVMTTGSPSHRYATRTLRGVFARLLSRLR